MELSADRSLGTLAFIYTMILYLIIYSIQLRDINYALPSQKEITAYLPLHAHFRALGSFPPCVSRSFSSSPGFRPTTTSALQVRKERMRIPELGPRGPMAVVKGVVGSQAACQIEVSHESKYQYVELRRNPRRWSTSGSSNHP
jgi:hypothetical protein